MKGDPRVSLKGAFPSLDLNQKSLSTHRFCLFPSPPVFGFETPMAPMPSLDVIVNPERET